MGFCESRREWFFPILYSGNEVFRKLLFAGVSRGHSKLTHENSFNKPEMTFSHLKREHIKYVWSSMNNYQHTFHMRLNYILVSYEYISPNQIQIILYQCWNECIIQCMVKYCARTFCTPLKICEKPVFSSYMVKSMNFVVVVYEWWTHCEIIWQSWWNVW